MTERLSLCSRANVLGEGWSAGAPAHPLTPFHPQGWHGRVTGTISTSLLTTSSSLGLFTDKKSIPANSIECVPVRAMWRGSTCV